MVYTFGQVEELFVTLPWGLLGYYLLLFCTFHLSMKSLFLPSKINKLYIKIKIKLDNVAGEENYSTNCPKIERRFSLQHRKKKWDCIQINLYSILTGDFCCTVPRLQIRSGGLSSRRECCIQIHAHESNCDNYSKIRRKDNSLELKLRG